MGSGSNQDIVRSIYAAVGEGRMPFELLDPQIELDLSERIFNPAVYRGHEGVRQFYGEIEEIWDSWLSEPEQLFESGERVVAFVRSRGRGKSSGVEVEDTSANVWTIRDGKAVAYRLYRDHDEALAAAGLPPGS
jgi:uncharacterized protein